MVAAVAVEHQHRDGSRAAAAASRRAESAGATGMRTCSARRSRSGTPPRSDRHAREQCEPRRAGEKNHQRTDEQQQDADRWRGPARTARACARGPLAGRRRGRARAHRMAQRQPARRSTVRPRGPTYSDCGRIRWSSACCSITCAHQPAHAPACEHRDERARLEPERLEHQRGVELDVGAQVAARLHLVEHAQRGLLDLAREIEQLPVLEVRARPSPRPPCSAPRRAGRAPCRRGGRIP